MGTISIEDMLSQLLAGTLYVPVAAPPKPDAWSPATLSKRDGTPWVVAFTDPELAREFLQGEAYPHGISVDARWVLRALPPAHGLLVNPGTDFCFDWPRPGIEGYLAKFNL